MVESKFKEIKVDEQIELLKRNLLKLKEENIDFEAQPDAYMKVDRLIPHLNEL